MSKSPPAARKRKVWKRDKWTCRYCGVRVEPLPAEARYHRPHPARLATVDHVIPKSRGGSHRKANLVTACRACNQAKADVLSREEPVKGGRVVVSVMP